MKKLGFPSMHIIQPSLLHGDRPEERTGEEVSYKVLSFLNRLGLLQKYRPISGREVAQAMVQAAVAATPGVHVYTLDELFLLAETDQA